MVAFAEGKGPLPPELMLKRRCDRYHALPESGGVLEQEAGLLDRMELAESIFHTWRAWIQRKPGHEGEWAAAHPEAWETVMKIMELQNGRSMDS